MQAIVHTFVAACSGRDVNYTTSYVEYAAANHKAFFAATDSKAATVVATSGDDGYALINRTQFGKERGTMEFENEGHWFQRFPAVASVLTEVAAHDENDVKVIRLDARKLDAVRKAINGKNGEVTLMIVGERVAVLGERGIGVIVSPKVQGDEFAKFKRVAERYTTTVKNAKAEHYKDKPATMIYHYSFIQ